MPHNSPTLEVCVDDITGLVACQGRADRIELCSALGVGGLTPSSGLVAAARHSRIPVFAMIRPRIGTFDFSSEDIGVALDDIRIVKDAGLAGIVIGATRDGHLDLAALKQMIQAADGLPCTLHRAIDLLDDPIRAMEDAISLGFARILTSGGAIKAVDGIANLAALQAASKGRIEIMAGSGVTKHNVAKIALATGIRAFHASCSAPVSAPPRAADFGFAPSNHRQTDAAEIDALQAVLKSGKIRSL